MTDTLRDDAVTPFPLGDREKDEEMRLVSGFKLPLLLVLAEKVEDSLGAGCIERAFVARDTLSRPVLSPDSPPSDSADD